MPRARAAAILTMALLLCVPVAAHAQAIRGPFIVVNVVDGDTIDVLSPFGKERVRLIGADCPELRHREPAIRVYAKIAAEFTAGRLLGSDVWLESDVRLTDQWGRTLAYVWTSRPPADGAGELLHTSMFSGVLLYEGWAMVLTVPPDMKYADALLGFQRDAMENDRGFWGYAKQVADAYGVVYKADTGKRYHVKGCHYLAESCSEITRREAFLLGLTPCSSCKPAPLTLQP